MASNNHTEAGVKSKARYRSSRKWRDTNKAYSRHYYHTVLKFNPAEIAKRKARNRKNYYQRYGLFPEQADAMKLCGCDICGSRDGKMNIDHCHNTGKVRGVLCNPCNLMIGYLERANKMKDRVVAYMKGEICAI